MNPGPPSYILGALTTELYGPEYRVLVSHSYQLLQIAYPTPPPLPPRWHLPKVTLIMGPPPSSPPPPPPEEWKDDMEVDKLEEVSNKYFLIFFFFLINFTSPPSLPQATRRARRQLVRQLP